MADNPKPFRYMIHAAAYLERARKQLEAFDAGDVSAFFYAALELRYGIEARVTEYLEPTLRYLGQNVAKIQEYVASKLLKKLVSANEYASEACTVALFDKEPGDGIAMAYTPVTKELAGMHGQLGELLHRKFFLNNPSWYLPTVREGKRGTLAEYRVFLGRVADELGKATSGRMLTHPVFTEIVREFIVESPDGTAEQNVSRTS